MALWRTSSRSNSFCRAIRFASAIFILFLERTVKNQASSKGRSNVGGVTRLNLQSRLVRDSPIEFLPGTSLERRFLCLQSPPKTERKSITRIGEKDNQLSSVMAGRSVRMTGTPK